MDKFSSAELEAMRPTESAIPDSRFNWSLRIPGSQIGSDEIHVWAFELNRREAEVRGSLEILSPDEQSRASRFHFQVHRDRFIVARAGLRVLLSCYLKTSAQSIHFCYSPAGKPFLAPAGEHAPVHFNLAHSEDLALLALSKNAPLGVDVEACKRIHEPENLVKRFFSERETRLFHGLPEDMRVACFYNLWTRKEALLKGTGEGIGASLKLVEVTYLPEERARFLSLPSAAGEASDWRLCHLSPAPGYTGALACRFEPGQIQCGVWDESQRA